jgi:cyclopropane fatty-acyl-phospholipid synthase-like methyltransferase
MENKENKQEIVKNGYEKAAGDYMSDRDQYKSLPYLKKLAKLLPRGSTVLDIGSGAGLPVDRFFIGKGYKVIGIDLSEKMLELARKNVPEASYKVKDMTDLQEGEYKVDAVVSFYAIFHTPREQHGELLKKINSFLQKGGLILITMGSGEWEGEEENFHGVRMWWSNYGPEKNKKIVQEAGFRIIFDEIDKSNGEKHLIILAKKN